LAPALPLSPSQQVVPSLLNILNKCAYVFSEDPCGAQQLG